MQTRTLLGYPQIIHFNRVFPYKPSILGSGVPRWPFHYFFERNGYPMGNWMDGKRLWSSFWWKFLAWKWWWDLFRDHLFCFSVEKEHFLSQEGVSKKKTANYPCQRFDFSRKQSHVSFILCCVRFAPFPYILRCIVTKELHHLNVEQICVGLVISQIMSANVSTTKAPPYPKSCYSRQHPPNPAFCHSGLGFLLIVNLTPKDCI